MTTPFSLSINPATAMPMPATSCALPAYTDSSNLKSTERGSSPAGIFALFTTLPFLSTRATLILVPPKSTPMTYLLFDIVLSCENIWIENSLRQDHGEYARYPFNDADTLTNRQAGKHKGLPSVER